MADYPNANDDTAVGLLQRVFAALTGGNAGGTTTPGGMKVTIGGAAGIGDGGNAWQLANSGADGLGRPLATINAYYDGGVVRYGRGNTDGGFVVSVPSATAPGLTQHSRMASADINATVVKGTAGKLYGFQIANNTASTKYVRLYNKASAPAPATDTPIRRIAIPPNGVASYHVGQGLDGFTAGIAYVATGGLADTDTTALAANDLTINMDYR